MEPKYWRTCFVSIVLALAPYRQAVAQSATAPSSGDDDFELGLKSYDTYHYEDALKAFRASIHNSGERTPVRLQSLANAEFMLGKYVGAARHYQEALSRFKTKDRKEECRAQLQEIRKRRPQPDVAYLRITLGYRLAPEAKVAVHIDVIDQVDLDRDVEVDPGDHEVSASGGVRVRVAEVRSGEKRSVEIPSISDAPLPGEATLGVCVDSATLPLLDALAARRAEAEALRKDFAAVQANKGTSYRVTVLDPSEKVACAALKREHYDVWATVLLNADGHNSLVVRRTATSEAVGEWPIHPANRQRVLVELVEKLKVAPPPPESAIRAEADKLFNQGHERLRDGDIRGARDLFKRSHDTAPSYKASLELAQLSQLEGDAAGARGHLERILAVVPQDHPLATVARKRWADLAPPPPPPLATYLQARRVPFVLTIGAALVAPVCGVTSYVLHNMYINELKCERTTNGCTSRQLENAQRDVMGANIAWGIAGGTALFAGAAWIISEVAHKKQTPIPVRARGPALVVDF